ncbi:hypothetical protein GCM10028813_09230 [Ramlibacter alkalitolerans]
MRETASISESHSSFSFSSGAKRPSSTASRSHSVTLWASVTAADGAAGAAGAWPVLRLALPGLLMPAILDTNPGLLKNLPLEEPGGRSSAWIQNPLTVGRTGS